MSEITQDVPAEATSEHPKTFAEMNLDPAVKQAIDEMGFEAPMQVQTAIYNQVMAGQDLMVQSRTGSGKTAAFGIPIAQLLTPGKEGVQAIILAPTRELALQVGQELTRICAYRNLQVVPVYGGAPMGRQIEALRAGAQIVAGTPGRVLDHIRRGTLKTSGIRMLVLDECDEMLSMGFQEEIEKIISELPPKTERQTLLFSATIPEEIERIGRRHMRGTEKVVLSADFVGVHEIAHRYYLVSGLGRTRDLLKIFEYERPESAIVFCNTREDTTVVASFLSKNGYDAEAISSDLSQADRERVMGRMRARDLKFLCATDIAARGIDISGLPFVVNYTFPESPEVYIHRTGRTGRAGAKGTAISLIGPREIGSFYYLKLLYKIRPEERELPTEGELRTRREGERYARLQTAITEEPGEDWRALARRVWESSDGERLVAALVKRQLDAPVHAPRAHTPAAPIAPRPKVQEAPAPLAGTPTPKPTPAASATEAIAAAPIPATEPQPERPEREPRSRGGERGRSGERSGRSGERSGRSGERSGRSGERSGRSGERSGRSGERPGRSGGDERSPQRVERPAAPTEPNPPVVGPAPGAPREFWETWIDEKAQPSTAPMPTRIRAVEAPPAETSVRGAAAEAPAVEPSARPRRERAPRETLVAEPGYVRLYLNVGKREGLSLDEVNRLVEEAAPTRREDIGKTLVLSTHSYLAVKEEAAPEVITALTGKKLGDRELLVERAKK